MLDELYDAVNVHNISREVLTVELTVEQFNAISTFISNLEAVLRAVDAARDTISDLESEVARLEKEIAELQEQYVPHYLR